MTEINNPLNETEYVALAAIIHALKPIQLGSEKLCNQDVTLLSGEGVFSLFIEELHEQSSAFSLKLDEALISRLSKGRQKALIGLVKCIKMGKCILQKGDHQDSHTNLEALPAKSVKTNSHFDLRLLLLIIFSLPGLYCKRM